jgi:hypothetical protein
MAATSSGRPGRPTVIFATHRFIDFGLGSCINGRSSNARKRKDRRSLRAGPVTQHCNAQWVFESSDVCELHNRRRDLQTNTFIDPS